MGATKVMVIFVVTSLLMWALPLGLLRAINQNVVPGLTNLSSQSKTLWSGGLAVLSVNIVMAFYIVLAIREPPVAPLSSPDPNFMRRANARLSESSAAHPRSHVTERSNNSEEVKNLKAD